MLNEAAAIVVASLRKGCLVRCSRSRPGSAGYLVQRALVPLPHAPPSVTPRIGYYVHHHGHGHRHRALAIARVCGTEITGLSTQPAPTGWPGPWRRLPDDAVPSPVGDVTAHGRLHYAPDHHPGLRGRMAAISAWIAAERPTLLVADVSVEVALLARLHGVPVVSMGMPGCREDAAHHLGFGVSDLVVGPWPAEAVGLMTTGTLDLSDRLVPVGAISRYAAQTSPAPVRPGHVVSLSGSGGTAVTGRDVADARTHTPGWTWDQLGPAGRWVDDPWPLLCAAEVVVSHGGQNAVAEIAAARRPAVVIPQDRPFDEQRHTGRTLTALGLPAVVLDRWPGPADWPPLLERAAALDGADWRRWDDGGGPRRAAEIFSRLAASSGDKRVPQAQ